VRRTRHEKILYRKLERAKPVIEDNSTTHSPLQQQVLAEHPQQFWLVEIWKENRGTFKELIKHILFFLLLLGSLIGFHEILGRSGLPANQKEILDKIHFYASIIALLIFSGSFVIKAIIFESRRK
jgi:hypothetical protein